VNAEKIHALEARAHEISWFDATARQRLRWFVDTGSFEEFLGPEMREMSPHLPVFNLPEAFDDGMIVRSRQIAFRARVDCRAGRSIHGRFLR
jgi:malonate decarboxylase beta subunit